MRIGIDYDEVMVELVIGWLTFYKQQTGRHFEKSQMTDYKFWVPLGITQDEAIRLFQVFHAEETPQTLVPVAGAIEGVRQLQRDHHCTIITARPEKYAERMQRVLGHHLPEVPRILHTTGFHRNKGKTKAQVCLEERIPLLIEDSAETAHECAEQDIEVLLMDQPWNQGYTHQHVTRVHSWPEILREVERRNP